MVNRGRITKPVLKTLLTKTKRGQIPVYDAWYDGNNDGFARLYVHHKMMTINGRMAGKDVKITWTGSQNFTGPGTLTNTDLVLRIVDPEGHRGVREELRLHPRQGDQADEEGAVVGRPHRPRRAVIIAAVITDLA